ncbi:hypothetical protein N7456_004020 [Penicillium angulare]|uniref:Zn(2)-C6 fungal-type domain-containing protein n=1 Tax=Penicillium angulare TaxID=116970 RepID=A0A9W9FWK5_9EURO|nr:hypothetical protein N7456_004020 [Penicillium angulare]
MGDVKKAPCYQCRCRKVRCDRREGGCCNCERLEFICSYQRPKLSQKSDLPMYGGRDATQVPPERRRTRRACIECHRQKMRCSGGLPACASCIERRRKCYYPEDESTPTEKTQKPSLGMQSSVSGSMMSYLAPEVILRVDQFFEHLYPIPLYSFLHEPSIRRKLAEGSLNQTLAFSLAALASACFSNDHNQTTLWLNTVEMEIWKSLDRPNIILLQSLILALHCHIQRKCFPRAYLLAGLASRTAIALRLNYERLDLSFIAQEIRRRVLWALSFLDVIFAVGIPDHEFMPYSIIYQQLPTSETLFYQGISEGAIACRIDSTEGCSILGACLQLSKLSRDIIRLKRQLALAESPLENLESIVQEFQKCLWHLHKDVASSFNYQMSSTDQLEEMLESRWFLRYLQLTLMWHQAHCDLYRLFIPTHPDSAPNIITDNVEVAFKANAVKACITHSEEIHVIFSKLESMPRRLAFPPSVAICAYQSTRLSLYLLHASSLNGKVETSSFLAKADLSLTILRQLFICATATEPIISDLENIVKKAKSDPEIIEKEKEDYHYRPEERLDRNTHLSVHSLMRQANFTDDGYE